MYDVLQSIYPPPSHPTRESLINLKNKKINEKFCGSRQMKQNKIKNNLTCFRIILFFTFVKYGALLLEKNTTSTAIRIQVDKHVKSFG